MQTLVVTVVSFNFRLLSLGTPGKIFNVTLINYRFNTFILKQKSWQANTIISFWHSNSRETFETNVFDTNPKCQDKFSLDTAKLQIWPLIPTVCRVYWAECVAISWVNRPLLSGSAVGNFFHPAVTEMSKRTQTVTWNRRNERQTYTSECVDKSLYHRRKDKDRYLDYLDNCNITITNNAKNEPALHTRKEYFLFNAFLLSCHLRRGVTRETTRGAI